MAGAIQPITDEASPRPGSSTTVGLPEPVHCRCDDHQHNEPEKCRRPDPAEHIEDKPVGPDQHQTTDRAEEHSRCSSPPLRLVTEPQSGRQRADDDQADTDLGRLLDGFEFAA
jgi:hypothetical protein